MSHVDAASFDRFAGELLRPGDAGYDDARRVHNGLIDKRPSLIARCLDTADIVAAVNVARDHSLELSVRGGGHNVAGRAVTDGGLMIDLSALRSVQVDPVASTARVAGGSTWGVLDRETQRFGLAVTGGMISSTGVGGLTLGGGLGWLMGRHGLTVDNLLAAELVVADGSVLSVSASEHADLFWAVAAAAATSVSPPRSCSGFIRSGPTVTGLRIAYPFAQAAECSASTPT